MHVEMAFHLNLYRHLQQNTAFLRHCFTLFELSLHRYILPIIQGGYLHIYFPTPNVICAQ
jgi:hypothetical protein